MSDRPSDHDRRSDPRVTAEHRIHLVRDRAEGGQHLGVVPLGQFALDAPLDVIVVRKLGVPFQPELGMGAIGENEVCVINDDVVYAEGGAWRLKTGETVPWKFERSYGCGQIAASRRMMVFRSATLGYLDLARNAGVENFGGIRPSCWFSAIPAGSGSWRPVDTRR